MICTSMHAQDAHLSQFYESRLQTNPAITGMFKGEYQAHLQYRNQWSAVASNPFTTSLFSYDKPYKKFGFGLLAMNNKAGLSNYTVTNLTFSAAYEITNTPADGHHLTTGVQFGFIQKSINSSQFVYNNQFENSVSGYDSGIPSYESFSNISMILPELNFGACYFNNTKTSKIKPTLGISAHHLTSPNETFINTENKLPVRWIIYSRMRIEMADKNYLEPHGLFMRQKNVNELNIGFLWNKYIPSSDLYVFVGPYYRNFDAVAIHFGGLYKSIRLGISYDFNISTLSSATNYRGGFEFSLTYKKSLEGLLPSIY